MEILDAIVAISICVVLPVLIVLIIFLASVNSDNKRAQVLLKAIETNHDIDADQLAKALQKPQKSRRDILNRRLLRGCILSLMGVVLCIEPLVEVFTSTDDDGPKLDMFTLGGVLLAIGISYLIVYFVTRKQVNDRQ